jgi:hypothetical protein
MTHCCQGVDVINGALLYSCAAMAIRRPDMRAMNSAPGAATSAEAAQYTDPSGGLNLATDPSSPAVTDVGYIPGIDVSLSPTPLPSTPSPDPSLSSDYTSPIAVADKPVGQGAGPVSLPDPEFSQAFNLSSRPSSTKKIWCAGFRFRVQDLGSGVRNLNPAATLQQQCRMLAGCCTSCMQCRVEHHQAYCSSSVDARCCCCSSSSSSTYAATTSSAPHPALHAVLLYMQAGLQGLHHHKLVLAAQRHDCEPAI